MNNPMSTLAPKNDGGVLSKALPRVDAYPVMFFFFCLWTLILLGRPQDIFPPLGVIRPALVVGVINVLLFLGNYGSISKNSFPINKQVKYYYFLIAVLVFGIPFSMYPRMSFMSVFTQQINVFVYFLIFYHTVNSIKKIYTVLLIGCLGSILYCAFAFASERIGVSRLGFGEVFDPNDLAFFILAFLPLNLLFISKRSSIIIQISCLSGVIVGVLVILLTGSRGGLLAFFAAACVLMLKTKTINNFLKITLCVICFAFVTSTQINTERFSTLLQITDDYNVSDEEGRLSLWTFGLKAMLTNPLTGVGVNCYPFAIGIDREERGTRTRKWQAPHSSVVQVGAETGVIGLYLYLLLSFLVVQTFNRVRRRSPKDDLVRISEMGLVGFTGLFVSGLFLTQAYSVYWAFYIVFSAVVAQLSLQEPTSADKKRS